VSTVVVSGIFVGLIYGLLAIGLVAVYRSSRIVNFAYGETGMLAAFVYFDMRLGSQRGVSLGITDDNGILTTLPLALLLGAAIGAAMEWVIARPLRTNPTLNGMVGTIAASLLLITFAVRRWGVDVRPSRPLLEGDGVHVFGITISPSQLLIGVCTVGILALFGALYRYTTLGLRLRATAIDPYAAALSGINTNATAMGAWAVAGALSALSAVLIAPLVAMNVFFMTVLALRSFAAALIGGLTSIWGAFVAGVLLGVIEAVVAFKSPVRGITDVVVAVGILALLLARPRGLVRADY
jgi:branched-subunit amino acid ABC-type transport system permease component